MNGRPSAGLSTTMAAAATSTAPVARSGFTVPSGSGPHLARDGDAVLHPEIGDLGQVLRIGDDLDDSGGVPQIDEGDAAVVAATGHPAGQDDLLAVEPGGLGRWWVLCGHCWAASLEARRRWTASTTSPPGPRSGSWRRGRGLRRSRLIARFPRRSRPAGSRFGRRT